MYPLAIKKWAVEDRPREKLLQKGRNVLTDSELLAVMIGSGTRNKSAVDLARDILQHNNNSFKTLSKLSVEELQQFHGIGKAKAVAIFATFEIAHRMNSEFSVERDKIKSSSDAYLYLKRNLSELEHEEFHVLYMNRGNKVLAVEQLSKGGLSGTIADGRIIFHRALHLKASSLILAHNHPSGQLKPSDADLKLTRSLVSFGDYIDMKVLDHLIFTENNYFSFADEGLLVS